MAKNGATPEVNWELKGEDVTFIAGEDLTGHQGKPVYLSAERTVSLMTAKDGTQMFVGFLVSGDKGSLVSLPAGANVSVRIEGFIKAVGQTAISVAKNLTVADSNGRLATASDNEIVIAESFEACSVINHRFTVRIIKNCIKGDNT